MNKNTDIFIASRFDKSLMKLFLLVLALLWVLPIYSVVTNSLKVGGLSNYTYVIENPINGVSFLRFFMNSAIVAIGSSSLVIIIGGLAGFAFSKINFFGKKIIYNAVLMCLAISGPVILVPYFFVLKTIGLYNTYWAVILPEVTLTIPFAVLMMKNYFDELPITLIESAFLDGANYFETFVHIFLPLAKPALINLGLLQVMWSFQDFFMPLMFTTDNKLYTATVAVNSFKGAFGLVGQNLGRYNAALVLVGLPAIIIFIFSQKYIVNGIMSGSIKD